ncbi:unnamed protein product [Dicrocoelium dendriticum]|nr:unnamed protein product [Dicrocoelium dendriticum]
MLPFVAIAFSLFGFIMKHFTIKELSAYSKAGSIANEALSAIRTVFAFGGEQKELDRYSKELKAAESVGIRKNTAVGGVAGSIGLTIFCSSALIFWYGIKLIIEENYDQGSVVLVFINVLMGSIYLGSALPNFQYFMNATASAREVYGTIEREPPIDKDADGVRLPNFVGNINFIGVSFSYPSRPDVPILVDFNLKLESGKTVALVGPSGSGKSTIVHMLQRFYDPLEGQILIEGVDIRSLALKDYRAQLGSVQQEPVLFEGTIADNIRMGKLDATQAEIEEAARLANAHEFILQQPEAYDTVIGERGGGMSGGQKQRIAIARALIRQPKLLLLDEATSALDTKSERIVQEALEKASVGRTTVVVAHRLTTVRNADLIIVLERGVVRESGTHEQLVAMNGLYAAMLRNQKQSDLIAESDEATEDELDGTPTEIVSDKLTIPDGVWRRISKDDTASVGSTVTIKQRFSVLSQAFTEQLKKVSPIKRLFALNRPELVQIILGCICCMIAGAVQPSFAILYSEIYEIFGLQAQPDLMSQRTSLICGLMAMLGFIRFFSMLGQGYLFGVSGERLTRRLRSQYFEAILRQEIGWFDRSENQAGALTAKLATEASKLKNISGSQLGSIVEAAVLFIVTIIIAFVNSWQLSLVFLGFFPLLIISGMFQVRNLSGSQAAEVSDVMRVAQEAISNDRTVCTLNLEVHFYDKFYQSMKSNYKATVRQCLFFALVYSLTQSIGMLSFGAVFALGVYLMEQQVLSVLNVFRTFAVMNMGAQSLGRSASFGPDAKKALASAKGILATIDRPSQIPLDQGIVPSIPFSGRVSFKHVYFRYPTRNEARVLKVSIAHFTST